MSPVRNSPPINSPDRAERAGVISNGMRERTSRILESIVREFIETGEPVSSERLFDNYDFGIKPAMIRSELNELAHLGFLEQAHHSAGRVPSNRGYEFYVNVILERVEPEFPREFASLFREGAIEDLLESMSEELKVLGVASETNDEEERTIYKEGLDNLFESLRWRTEEGVMQIIRDFERLDERIPKAKNILGQDFLDVFIGNKSPVTKSDDLSVIIGDYDVNGERMFLMAIGPKCMNYEKPLKIFKGLKEVNKNNERR